MASSNAVCAKRPHTNGSSARTGWGMSLPANHRAGHCAHVVMAVWENARGTRTGCSGTACPAWKLINGVIPYVMRPSPTHHPSHATGAHTAGPK